MKTKKFTFPKRSLIPTLLCCALAAPVVGISSLASAQEPISVVAMAEQVTVVSVNSASAPSLAEAMKGVGIVKAEAIVAWRQQNGNFTSLEQLLEVKGIGEKTLELNRSRIKL